MKLRLVDHGNGTYTLATRVRQPGNPPHIMHFTVFSEQFNETNLLFLLFFSIGIHALHVELQKTPSGKAFGVGKSP